MKNRWIFFIIVGLLMIGPSSKIAPSVRRAQGQTGNDAPYIYYFSDDLNAWVIERADGTDRRLLGQGVVQKALDAYSIVVDGAGWSPSGKWFAFSAQSVFPYPFRGIDDSSSYIISSDGNSQLPYISHLKHAKMAWSPNEDLLLVAANFDDYDPASTAQQGYPAELQTSFMLIDTNQNKVLAALEERIELANEESRLRFDGPVAVKWIAGGEYGVTLLQRNDGNSETTIVTLFDRFGGVSQHQFDQVLSERPLWPRRTLPISSNGDIAYMVDKSLIVENIISGIQHEFDVELTSAEAIWNDTGQYALIRGGEDYLLTFEGDEARLNEISLGELQLIPESGQYALPTLWSPGGRLFPFHTGDQSIYLFDAKMSELTLVQLPFALADSWTWINEYEAVVGGPHLLDSNPPQQVFALYDFRDNTYQAKEILLKHMEVEAKPVLSREYIAHMQDGAIIQNLATGSVTKIRPDAASYLSLYGDFVEWSTDGNWLLLYDNALVAGGVADASTFLGIVRFDGTARRDLTFSPSPSRISLDWLPSAVELDALPATISDDAPIPVQRLMSYEWSFYVEWSPDGQQLASGLGPFDFGDIWIWNLVSGQGELHFEQVDWLAHVEWQRMANGEYTPYLDENEILRDTRFDNALAISTDERWVVARNSERQNAIIEVESGKELVVIGQVGSVVSASFSPDGQFLAIGFFSDSPVIYDTQTWKIVGRLPYTGNAVAFSPDSQYLAVGVSWDVEIWRVSDLIEQAAE